MSESEITETQDPYSPAMVFTSRAGHVVFVNRKFARLLGGAVSIMIGGARLHEVLPIPSTSVDKLLHAIENNKSGFVAQFPVNMPTTRGQFWKSNCNAVAAFDLKGAMIGLDLVLENTAQPAAAGMSSGVQTHSEAVMSYVRDVFNESKIRQSATFTQSYLTAQLEVMQIMLARVGGPATLLAFEQVITKTANKNLIPCVIQHGHLTFTEKNIDIQKYSILLQSAVRYAIDVIGRQIVKQEMLEVDQFIEPGLLQLVSQLDLKAVFYD
jgi:hypothetical protein